MKARPTTWAPTRMICARYLACGDSRLSRPRPPPHCSPAGTRRACQAPLPPGHAPAPLRLPGPRRSAPDPVRSPRTSTPAWLRPPAPRALTHPLRALSPRPGPVTPSSSSASPLGRHSKRRPRRSPSSPPPLPLPARARGQRAEGTGRSVALRRVTAPPGGRAERGGPGRGRRARALKRRESGRHFPPAPPPPFPHTSTGATGGAAAALMAGPGPWRGPGSRRLLSGEAWGPRSAVGSARGLVLWRPGLVRPRPGPCGPLPAAPPRLPTRPHPRLRRSPAAAGRGGSPAGPPWR